MTISLKTAAGKPELLAPAGSIESFFAAIENGADAVYAGLRDFSARSRARNFTHEDLSRMAALCRREGRRLYVTLNTLLKDRELPEIVSTLSGLADARVDALIIQDPGLAQIARDHFPTLALHASTQMTIHNLEGVRQAASLGFRRVVLARELSLPEIRAIATDSPIELECFIHGALCFCISGQCLFSSFLGGRSGNRGDCAQPCRRRAKLDGANDYPFSTRDLWGIDAVPALASAGVSCLKIEGRMKPAVYVATVTAAYRKVIDASPGDQGEAQREAKAMLTEARGRAGTPGFLVEGSPNSLTDSEIQGAVGQPLGAIETVASAGFTFVSSERFHAGDRLRVMPGNDREGRTFTVRRIVAGGKEGVVGHAGVRVTVPAPFRFSPGDAVYRVADSAPGHLSEAACLRKLAAIPAERISCNVSLSLEGETLTVCGATDDLSYEMSFPVGLLDPARGDRAADVLRARFTETGESPFALAAFDATRFGDRFLPPSRLKEIRRGFYESFGHAVRERTLTARRDVEIAALRSLDVTGYPPGAVPPQLWLGVPSATDVAALDRPEIGGFLVPLGLEAVRRIPESLSRLSTLRDRIIWRLPFWITGNGSAAIIEAVQSLMGAGFRQFEANNPAHFRILGGSGARILAGWRLGTMNRAALGALHAQGASDAVLSPEDDGENVAALLRSDLPIGRWVTIYEKVPLMVSRIPVSRAAGQSALSTDGHDLFEIAIEDGLTVLRGTTPFSITERIDRLRSDGAGAFIAELSGTSAEERETVVQAALAGFPVPGASSFNFDRRPLA